MSDPQLPICVGITGASGAIYAVRLLRVLLATNHEVHLSISPSGAAVIEQELGVSIDLEAFDADALLNSLPQDAFENSVDEINTGALRYDHWQNYYAPMASGSHRSAGMVVCPCSGTTLAAIANGSSGNLIQRAAEVHLKEQRKLVLVPRETPLSLTHIENLRRAALAGAVVLPATPGWYHGPPTVQNIVDFVVARICDQLEVENTLIPRWGE